MELDEIFVVWLSKVVNVEIIDLSVVVVIIDDDVMILFIDELLE